MHSVGTSLSLYNLAIKFLPKGLVKSPGFLAFNAFSVHKYVISTLIRRIVELPENNQRV